MNYQSTSLDDGTLIFTSWNRKLTSVEITDGRFGITANGNAKVHPDDEFDFEIGYALASTRATARLLHKIEKKIAKTPQIVKEI